MGKKRKGKAKANTNKVVGWNSDDWVLVGGGAPGAGGKLVTPSSSMTEPTVYSCIKFLAEDLAKVPIKIYKVTRNGRTEARNSALWRLLNYRPNNYQTRMEWQQYTQQALLGYGNAYNLLSFNGRGEIEELLPIHPNRVEIFEATDGELFYEISSNTTFETANTIRLAPQAIAGRQSGSIRVPQRLIWHMRWEPKGSGIYGATPIEHHRDAISTALAQQEFSGKMMANDARPSVVLRHPSRIKPEAAKRLKDAWNKAYQSSANAARTAVLEEGMEVQTLSMNAVDAQFVEQRKFSTIELARIFRVPPTKLMVMDRATYSNIEQENLAYITDSMMPHYERWESSIERWLIPERQWGKLVAEFDLDKLLRGDSKARFDAYAQGRQWGVLTANEARQREGLNPVDGGDMLLQPLNMTAAGNDPLEVKQEEQRLQAEQQAQNQQAQDTEEIKALLQLKLKMEEEDG